MSFIYLISNKLQHYLGKNILYVLLATFFVTVLKLFLLSRKTLKGWSISDWLINYDDGGFKRRGLGGSLIFMLQDFTSLSLSTVIFSIQVIFYFYFFIKIWEILISRKIDPYFLTFVYLPVSVFFLWVSAEFLGRKEVILFAIALYFVSGDLSNFKKYMVIFLFAVSLFLHEGLYFFFTFLIAYQYVIEKKIDYQFAVSLILISTLIMLSFVLFGGNLDNGKSIAIIKSRGTELVAGNAINYDGSSKIDFIKTFIFSYSLHLLEFMFVIAYFSYYIMKNYKEKFQIFLKFIIVSVVFILPLFVLAIDWMRWIHIYTILIMILVSLFLEKHHEKRIVYNDSQQGSVFFLITVLFFLEFLFHLQHDQIIDAIKKFLFA